MPAPVATAERVRWLGGGGGGGVISVVVGMTPYVYPFCPLFCSSASKEIRPTPFGVPAGASPGQKSPQSFKTTSHSVVPSVKNPTPRYWWYPLLNTMPVLQPTGIGRSEATRTAWPAAIDAS